ncbi:hypothetical protein TNCT_616981 [Trichonephila clavata]|uniref:Uncharacterized protein n=1 Tax=Trichonephila clavata TaxID=2740835 RepID=A0A8X6H173_TRICU|nr:hypothetical protein TNCT_616981 [Trichonephila clavata]
MPRKRAGQIYPANSPLRMLPITRNQSAFIRNYEIWRNDLEEKKDFLETCKSLSIGLDNPFIITRSRFSLLNMDEESLYTPETIPDYNTRNDPTEINDCLLKEISLSPRLKDNWIETESSFPDAEKEMRIQKEKHSEFPSETFEIHVPFKNESATFVPNLSLTTDIQSRLEKMNHGLASQYWDNFLLSTFHIFPLSHWREILRIKDSLRSFFFDGYKFLFSVLCKLHIILKTIVVYMYDKV